MARPSTIHDLNDYEKYEVLAEFDVAALMVADEALLIQTREMLTLTEEVSKEDETYVIERSGGFAKIKRLKRGQEAEKVLQKAQEYWDHLEEQYRRLKNFEKVPEDGKSPRWALNSWARREDLPTLTEAEYAGLRPVPEPMAEPRNDEEE